MRVRLNRLPVAEENNRQQQHDGPAHRHNIVHAQQAQRDQQCQCRLRPVCGRAQCVQSKDWNAGNGADVLGPLFAGGQRPPETKIQYARGNSHLLFVRRPGNEQGKAVEGIVSRRFKKNMVGLGPSA